MFRSKGFLIAAMTFLVFVVRAAAVEATLTAEPPKGVLLPFRYFASSGNFVKASEDAGTVSPHAVVARLGGPIEFAIAIDSSTPDAAGPDLVRFDFTAQGHFADAPTAPLNVTSQQSGMVEAKIGPAVIQVPVGGQTIQVRVWGDYTKYQRSYRSVKIGFDLGLQGVCDFGGKSYAVCVADATGNLRVGDAFKPVVTGSKLMGRTEGDTLFIDTGEGAFEDPAKVICVGYGQPVWLDGAWYEVKIGDDGKSLAAQRVDLPTGRLKIANANWEILLVSPERVMWAWSTQANQEVPVPAGEYVVMRYKQYAEFRKADGGAILMEGPGPEQGQMMRTPVDPVVKVLPDATAELAIGAPLTVKPEISRSGQQARFSLKVTDAAGHQPNYVELKGGDNPVATVHVLDASGTDVHTAKLEYG
jgi:hypothetical protein